MSDKVIMSKELAGALGLDPAQPLTQAQLDKAIDAHTMAARDARKPIHVIREGRKFRIEVKGAPVVFTDDAKTKVDIGEVGDARKPALMTYKDAENLAHKIGRYKLQLGDFVGTYTTGLRTKR